MPCVAGKVLWTCLFLELLLVFFDATLNYAGWLDQGSLRRLFNITREDGLASWFGVTQTSFCAVTLWLLWWIEKKAGTARRLCAGWLLLAVFFTYMAIDDGGMVHERVGSAFKGAQYDALQEGRAGWMTNIHKAFPSYAWQLLFVPFFAAIGIFMALFLWQQMNMPRLRAAMLGAFGLLAVAIGLDFAEGLPLMHEWNPYRILARNPDLDKTTQALFNSGSYATLKHFSKSVEEFLEMAAITLLWTSFLVRLGLRSPSIRLNSGSSPEFS